MIVGNKSENNATRKVGVWDHLDVHGSMMVSGPIEATNRINFNHKPGDRNTDPYYLEKVVTGGNKSELRLTINDDADESFTIFGNSCGAGNCGGPGTLQHRFWSNGRVEHAGDLIVRNVNLLNEINALKAQLAQMTPQSQASASTGLSNVKFVRLRRERGVLNIAQIAVFNDQNVNIAQGKTATASSVYQNGPANAANAVNGELMAKPYPRIFHSADADPAPTITIDLGTPSNIARVVIYNRADCCKERVVGSILELIDGANRVLKTVTISDTADMYTFVSGRDF